MVFIFSRWERFCKALVNNGVQSVTAKDLLSDASVGNMRSCRWVNLKHDVESNPEKALELARIEARHGHHATYYVQSYLMTERNQPLFLEIQRLGHEVSYHHDVIDGGKGDIEIAYKLFSENLEKFHQLGFTVQTVCQHGNPMTDFDNRDFFRNTIIQSRFPGMADIMVNFKELLGQDYVYISDVGMAFKIVNNPYNKADQDMVAYTPLGGFNRVVTEIIDHKELNYIISSHPHRYYRSYMVAWFKKVLFTVIRFMARVLFRIPGLKKLLFKFNYISKKL